MTHEPAPPSRSAQYPDAGPDCLGCGNARQHVVVVGHHHVPLGLLPARETEEIHHERGVDHFFGRLPVTIPQGVEKMHAMLLQQSIRRSVRETRSELNTIVSSQEGDSTNLVLSHPIRVGALHLADALKPWSSRRPFVPSRIQSQAHPEPRATCGGDQVVRYDAFHVLEGRSRCGVRAFCLQFRARGDDRRMPVDKADGQMEGSRHMRRRSAYSPPRPCPAATSTAAGSGVKSSPGLMKRLRSRPYCLS